MGKLIVRERYMEMLRAGRGLLDVVKVVTGMRRSGKAPGSSASAVDRRTPPDPPTGRACEASDRPRHLQSRTASGTSSIDDGRKKMEPEDAAGPVRRRSDR